MCMRRSPSAVGRRPFGTAAPPVAPRSEGAAVYRQDDLVGRSWPDVSTASRPAIGLATAVPPLPRTERPAATDARSTGRIAVEDLPRPTAWTAPSPVSVPAPRGASDELAAADDDLDSHVVEDAGDDPADDTAADGADVRTPRRRLPSAPGRKPALLLVALVLGALIAALPLGAGPDQPTASSGLDYGLGMEPDTGFAGGVDLAGARGEISQAEAEARLSEIAASRAARAPKFFLPTQGRMTTCFCMRWGSMHWGLDLAAPLGTPIVAATDGVVLRAGAASGYGKAIYIQDADGDVHVYGHMRYLYVEAGDVVSAGDLIAKVGSEGQSTGPHLHYEIHKGGINGKPTDPQDWLGARGITI
jgi:hypothetical protein